MPKEYQPDSVTEGRICLNEVVFFPKPMAELWNQ